jgi:hypothetical protein
VAYATGALLNMGVGVASGAAGSAKELLAPDHYDIHRPVHHSVERHRSMERLPARRERASAAAAADTAPPPAQLVEGKAQQAVPPYLLDREEQAPHHRMSMIDKERHRRRDAAAAADDEHWRNNYGRVVEHRSRR